MELTVQNVYGLLLRSKLLPVEAARTMYTRWQDEAKGSAGDLARFAAWMVARGYVTEYQASLLARGHANGFFLGEYTILERLGKGRMAGVYKARHRLGQTVAIKVLPPSRARDTMLLARFQREARLAVRLGHPNIVRAFQVGQEDDLHYLVMEHLEGATLEDVLETKKRLLPADAVRIVFQALSGLAHIHEQGLVHRDLKPSNLMLVPAPRENSLLDCTVKILDIGLVRALFEEGAEPPDSGLTREGVLLGTPDYMAPEQARDPRAADIRSDIYSLGCVLYHTLAGRPPYPDTNIISQMIRHATEAPRPLRDFNTAIPDGLQQIVNWMMAKDPAGRYPTPQRAAQALEVFLAAGSVSASSPDLDPQMKSYLSWLEGKEGETPSEQSDGRSAGPGAANMPTMPIVSLPSSTPPPAPEGSPAKPKSKPIVAAPRSDRPSASERSGRQKKKPPPPPVVQQEAAAQDEERVDVELLPVPPPVARTGGLTRRDLVMFFAGVGSGLAAYAVGRAFAGLLDRPRPVEQD